MPKSKRMKKSRSKARKPVKKSAPKVSKPTVNKMDDEKAYEMMRNARLPLAKYTFVKNEKDLGRALRKVGFPCVMKISGKSIVHKTELGGVKSNIHNEQEAMSAFKTLKKINGCEKVLLQQQVSGVELIVGAKSDPQFGHVVSVGIGGIYVEIFKDVTFRIVPIGQKEATNMLRELKGYEILTGARAQHPIKTESLVDVLMKIGKFAANKKIKELDLNPVFCNEHGCFVADVRIIN